MDISFYGHKLLVIYGLYALPITIPIKAIIKSNVSPPLAPSDGQTGTYLVVCVTEQCRQ
jgi:hypothetical protein